VLGKEEALRGDLHPVSALLLAEAETLSKSLPLLVFLVLKMSFPTKLTL
jgi:hypothetical protein